MKRLPTLHAPARESIRAVLAVVGEGAEEAHVGVVLSAAQEAAVAVVAVHEALEPQTINLIRLSLDQC